MQLKITSHEGGSLAQAWGDLLLDLYSIGADGSPKGGERARLDELLPRLEKLMGAVKGCPGYLGATPLHTLAGNAAVPQSWVCVEVVALMKESGVDLEAWDHEGRTALMVASCTGLPTRGTERARGCCWRAAPIRGSRTKLVGCHGGLPNTWGMAKWRRCFWLGRRG